MFLKLKQACDRRFFVFVTVVFLVSFLAGLIWFWGEAKALTGKAGKASFATTLEEVEAKNKSEGQEEVRDKDETNKSGQKENITEASSSPAVLGEATETVIKETTTQTQASLNIDSVNLTSLANEALLALKDCLLKNDASGLYSLAGEDLRTTFGKEGFYEALAKGEEVSQVNIFSGPTIAGEWAEATLELIYSDNTTKKYTVFFHLEEGAWKLFGTGEI